MSQTATFEVLFQRANQYYANEAYQEARNHYEQLIEQGCHATPVYVNLACTCTQLGDRDAARRYFEQALAQEPTHRDALANLAVLHTQMGHDNEALNCYEQLLKQTPDCPDTHRNLGLMYGQQNRINEAITHLKTYTNSHYFDPEIQTTLAYYYLKQERWDLGWQQWQWRLWQRDYAETIVPYAHRPRWDGRVDDMGGKTLLICPEQGLGDAIQFSRYLPWLKSILPQTTIIAMLPDALYPLFNSACGVDAYYLQSASSTLPDFDYYYPLLSLALQQHTKVNTIPKPVTLHLAMDQLRKLFWDNALKQMGSTSANRKRIGIVWAGNSNHADDHKRSCALSDFIPIIEQYSEHAYFSLQMHAARAVADANAARNISLVDLGSDIHDFVDTAYLLTQLDALVCVDTSIAHLAGTLGVPTYLALQKDNDWRWLMARNDSPWYESVRLFRQESVGNWEQVFSAISQAIKS